LHSSPNVRFFFPAICFARERGISEKGEKAEFVRAEFEKAEFEKAEFETVI